MPTKDEVNKFSIHIETIVIDKRIPIMDAIIEHCDKTGLEVEMDAKLVSPSLKKKLEIEARRLNFLPRTTTRRLPI